MPPEAQAGPGGSFTTRRQRWEQEEFLAGTTSPGPGGASSAWARLHGAPAGTGAPERSLRPREGQNPPGKRGNLPQSPSSRFPAQPEAVCPWGRGRSRVGATRGTGWEQPGCHWGCHWGCHPTQTPDIPRTVPSSSWDQPWSRGALPQLEIVPSKGDTVGSPALGAPSRAPRGTEGSRSSPGPPCSSLTCLQAQPCTEGAGRGF